MRMISDSSLGARGKDRTPVRSFGEEIMRGREAEQQVIRGLLRRAQRGLGGVVLVEGEPGIGKSLLLREAADEATKEGFRWRREQRTSSAERFHSSRCARPRALKGYPVAWLLA